MRNHQSSFRRYPNPAIALAKPTWSLVSLVRCKHRLSTHRRTNSARCHVVAPIYRQLPRSGIRRRSVFQRAPPVSSSCSANAIRPVTLERRSPNLGEPPGETRPNSHDSGQKTRSSVGPTMKNAHRARAVRGYFIRAWTSSSKNNCATDRGHPVIKRPAISAWC